MLSINASLVQLSIEQNLSRAQNGIAADIQRLSSGLRVNSAQDDPAGLQIAARMTSQVDGDGQALQNANNAISMSQVTDSSLAQISHQLQSMRTLAVEAANGSNSPSDLVDLNQEVERTLAQINQVASTTSFNGQSLLNGSGSTDRFQVGANAGDTVDMSSVGNMGCAALGSLQFASSTDLRTVNAGSGGAFAFAGTYTTNPIANLNFSIPYTPFIGGSASSAGAVPTDYAGVNASVISVDGNTITLNSNYGSEAGVASAIQQQLNSIHGGWYNVTVGAGITVTKTANAASAASAVGLSAVSGGNSAAFSGGAASAGQLGTTSTQAGMSVDGHVVSLTGDYSGDAGAMVAAIQSQLDHTAPGAYQVSGDASGISITKVGSIDAPVIADFSGTGANVFSQAPVAALVLKPGDLSIQVGSQAAIPIVGSFNTAESLASAIQSTVTGMDASVDTSNGELQLSAQAPFTLSGTQAQSGGSLDFASLNSQAQGNLTDVNVLSFSAATDALRRIDSALATVDSARAACGALQNRLDQVITNLQTSQLNTSAARSQIIDADFATVTANLASNQVLAKAGMALLAHANVTATLVLGLLK